MTKGQELYEKLHPKYVTLYNTSAPWATAITMPNPIHVIDWKFLTAECHAKYEKYAIGHHLVGGGA